MTITTKRKIIQRIYDLENDIAELKKARAQIGINGYASATLSTSGGSKSYTRFDLESLGKLLEEMLKELAQYKDMLVSGSTKTINSIQFVYS